MPSIFTIPYVNPPSTVFTRQKSTKSIKSSFFIQSITIKSVQVSVIDEMKQHLHFKKILVSTFLESTSKVFPIT